MKIEDVVVKIYKCFYLYDATVTEIQNFYDKTDVELKILNMMCFLFFLVVDKQIFEMFEALKNYFVNQSRCPTLSLNIFVSQSSKFYFTIFSKPFGNL